jgi:hypothetical protein
VAGRGPRRRRRDWDEIDEIVRDAFRQVASKSLAAQLDG